MATKKFETETKKVLIEMPEGLYTGLRIAAARDHKSFPDYVRWILSLNSESQ